MPGLALIIVSLAGGLSVVRAEPTACAVLVYGGTPAGIAAAIAAADDGESVIVIEPTGHVGGLVTSGLSHADFHAREGLSGAYWQFARNVEAYYVAKYGRDSPQVRDCFGGAFAEPHVNLAVFQAMLAGRESVRVVTQTRLNGVERRGDTIQSARFTTPDGTLVVTAAVFIDASYEGDLMAAANVPYRVGREARGEYGETLAPEKADAQLQAYNFRLTMTTEPGNRVTVRAPEGYRREDFAPVLEILKSGKIKSVFGYPSGCIFKAQTPPLPNGKFDINDVSQSAVRLSLPGQNRGWPDGTPVERERIFAEHLRDQVGLLYFLQNDGAVPERFRTEARRWGWCRDEFEQTNHLPPQLYVREARRMVGQFVFTQKDSEPTGDEARAVQHPDSIASGEYGNNCHGTGHDGPRFGGKHTGEFYHPVPPYQIPYGVIVPKRGDKLAGAGGGEFVARGVLRAATGADLDGAGPGCRARGSSGAGGGRVGAERRGRGVATATAPSRLRDGHRQRRAAGPRRLRRRASDRHRRRLPRAVPQTRRWPARQSHSWPIHSGLPESRRGIESSADARLGGALADDRGQAGLAGGETAGGRREAHARRMAATREQSGGVRRLTRRAGLASEFRAFTGGER